ncbi:MAG: hypothetical protein EOM24_28415, partial [Chloroflexia bacterium]|nr:hypothetical protein [Chloroflexia bacterium]
RYTREIRVLPALPEPGEQVRVQVPIHNYGLQDQNQSFSVAFYLADSGSTNPQNPPSPDRLIGRTVVDGIPARSSVNAEVDWITPTEQGLYTMYAVIEPTAGQLAQVRADNDAAYGFISVGSSAQGTLAPRAYLPFVRR